MQREDGKLEEQATSRKKVSRERECKGNRNLAKRRSASQFVVLRNGFDKGDGKQVIFVQDAGRDPEQGSILGGRRRI